MAELGDQIAPRWHYGVNLVFEHQLGALQENEYAVTSGVSYSIADSCFALGAELKLETVDRVGERFGFDAWEALIGPSMAWNPVPPMHMLLVALAGSETEYGAHTPLIKPTLVLGWDL